MQPPERQKGSTDGKMSILYFKKKKEGGMNKSGTGGKPARRQRLTSWIGKRNGKAKILDREDK